MADAPSLSSPPAAVATATPAATPAEVAGSAPTVSTAAPDTAATSPAQQNEAGAPPAEVTAPAASKSVSSPHASPSLHGDAVSHPSRPRGQSYASSHTHAHHTHAHGHSGGLHDDRAIVLRGFGDGEAISLYGVALSLLSNFGAIRNHALAADGCSIYVTFEHTHSAETAFSLAESGAMIMPAPGVRMERCKPDPKTLVPSSSTIVLKNLAYDVTLDTLKAYLEGLAAAPTAVDMYVEGGGKFNGVAFAKYKSTEDARLVMQQLHGSQFRGRTVKAEYKRVKSNPAGGIASPVLSGMAASGNTVHNAAPMPTPGLTGLPFPFGSPLRNPASSPSSAAAYAIAGITSVRDIPFLSLGPDALQAAPEAATTHAPASSGGGMSSLTAAVQARIAQLHGVPIASAASPAATDMSASPSAIGARSTSDGSSSSTSAISGGGKGARFSITAHEFQPTSPLHGPITGSFTSPLAAALFAAMPPDLALAPASLIDGMPVQSMMTAPARSHDSRKGGHKHSEARPRSKTGANAHDMTGSAAAGVASSTAAGDVKPVAEPALAVADKKGRNRDRSRTMETPAASTGGAASTAPHAPEAGKASKKSKAKTSSGRKEKTSSDEHDSSDGAHAPASASDARRSSYTIRPADGTTWRQREAARAAAGGAPAVVAAAPAVASTAVATTEQQVATSAAVAAATVEPAPTPAPETIERRPRTSSAADAAATVRYAKGPQQDDHNGRGFGRRSAASPLAGVTAPVAPVSVAT